MARAHGGRGSRALLPIPALHPPQVEPRNISSGFHGPGQWIGELRLEGKLCASEAQSVSKSSSHF